MLLWGYTKIDKYSVSTKIRKSLLKGWGETYKGDDSSSWY